MWLSSALDMNHGIVSHVCNAAVDFGILRLGAVYALPGESSLWIQFVVVVASGDSNTLEDGRVKEDLEQEARINFRRRSRNRGNVEPD